MTVLQRRDSQDLITFNDEKVQLIKKMVAKDATDAELQLFLHQSQRTGLDPLAKQIYFRKQKSAKYGDQVTIMTGIDGYRLIADRTGKYAGNDDPVFDNEENPRKATVTVYKIVCGIRCPYTATARWDQYYPGDSQGFMWRKMPHLMLGKCAEALALRKAFPAELSGLYVREEMDQAAPEAGEPRYEPTGEAVPFEGPSATIGEPYLERYSAQDNKHRALVRELAKPYGVTNNADLHALSNALAGPPAVEMDHIAAAVKEWVDDRGKV